MARKRTPIERIFQAVFKREMTREERRILLDKPAEIEKRLGTIKEDSPQVAGTKPPSRHIARGASGG